MSLFVLSGEVPGTRSGPEHFSVIASRGPAVLLGAGRADDDAVSAREIASPSRGR